MNGRHLDQIVIEKVDIKPNSNRRDSNLDERYSFQFNTESEKI